MIDHTLGAILIGGASTRMGTPKAELEYLGVPFVDHAVATLSLVVSDVVISGGSYDGHLTAVPDTRQDGGPLAGILAALRHAEGRAVMVLAVDLPLVTVDLVSRLVEPRIARSAVRVATDGTSTQPLCGVYGPAVESMIEGRLATGKGSVFGLLEAVDTVEYIHAEGHTLSNINTPDDFESLVGGGEL